MKYLLRTLLIVILGTLPSQADEAPGKPSKKPAQDTSFEYRFPKDLEQTPDSIVRQKEWFRDAKFGAFIHFGVYSVLEGAYKGKVQGPRYAEWIWADAKISAAEYREVAMTFNPVEFDAEEWVQIFKDNGMKYVVITSKHHDGFALFDSAVSDFNIVDATPFKRDIIKELSEACHRNGLKFGVYYSQAQDWEDPDAPVMSPRRTRRGVMHPDLPQGFKPDFDKYLGEKSLPQVEELMKNYEIDLVWFDTPINMTFERAKQFTDVVRKYRPNCLINSRLIQQGRNRILAENLELFDYISVGDKEVPTTKLPLYFESPDSVSTSYGYKTFGNHQYHKEVEMIHRLVHTVCSGGNYLLNNGPMGNGKIDPEAVRLYGVIGDWMKVNGESIYATIRNPLPERPQWGDVSASKDGKTLYLHILEWPKSRAITVDDLPSAAASATYLATSENANFAQQGKSLEITLTAKPLDPYDTVVKVTLQESTDSEIRSSGHSNPARDAWAKLAGKSVGRPEFAFVENDPALPNVLIYGDSISIMYTQRVREKLKDKANVYRLYCNGGDSSSFIAKMTKMHEAMRDEKLDQPWTFDWDVIQFNIGLHDLKYISANKLDKQNGKQVTTLQEYQKNLDEIVGYLKKLAPEAKLIFATTTPVPEGEPGRFAGDAVKYNKVAEEVMSKYPEITINDLYSFTKPNQQVWWNKPGDVHYKPEGRSAQGDEVARIILESLAH
ncbi:Alpha-L-fucosidase [Novipirellula aureliae]|uniref:alpha-L-fucosidase n=1 Tax=Novipirellula aureliae TaxID=2527966 RepID=A0A5C6E893_9BACT|nr:alpha-L-fucosidase [Novipirellula aureliae]TWU44197.1 Alpha-L-fucosidase [Novipirellula aureliae]